MAEQARREFPISEKCPGGDEAGTFGQDRIAELGAQFTDNFLSWRDGSEKKQWTFFDKTKKTKKKTPSPKTITNTHRDNGKDFVGRCLQGLNV